MVYQINLKNILKRVFFYSIVSYNVNMNKNKNQTAYNKIAKTWHDYRFNSKTNQIIIDFASYLKPNGNVLDVGCGTGYPIAHYLAKAGFLVTGIDISEEMIRLAQLLKLSHATFSVQDILSFHSPMKFDAIIAFDSLFHLELDNQLEALTIIANHMNKDGYFLMTHGKRHGTITGEMFGETFHYASLSASTYQSHLIDLGFSILTSIEDYQEATTGTRDYLLIAKKTSKALHKN
jgi:SAM-dependent methyltransferase